MKMEYVSIFITTYYFISYFGILFSLFFFFFLCNIPMPFDTRTNNGTIMNLSNITSQKKIINIPLVVLEFARLSRQTNRRTIYHSCLVGQALNKSEPISNPPYLLQHSFLIILSPIFQTYLMTDIISHFFQCSF